MGKGRKEMNTTSTINRQSKISLGSMQQAILELNAWAKIKRMKKVGIKPILYFKKYQKRPTWLIKLCKKENVEIKRSKYVEKGKAYLIDTEAFRNDWFKSRLKSFNDFKEAE